MMEEHVKYVGCKTPYHPKSLDFPICRTMADMLKANTSLVERLPPCREIGSIEPELFELIDELRFDSFLLCWNRELCLISEFSFEVELLNLLLLREELTSFELL